VDSIYLFLEAEDLECCETPEMRDGAPPRPGWLLDEHASAGRENLDPVHVARYDAKEDGDALGEVRLLQGLGLDAGSTVLDLGAGTGQFTLAVAPLCARVIAADVSPVMQELLCAKVDASSHTNVECVGAGFLTYEHEGDPVDFVYCRYALHHLPDFWKALALVRLRLCMRPEAVLRLWDVVYSFQPEEAEERIERWCATGGTGVETDWARAELEEHVRDEHSTFTWLLEPMIERAGFRIDDADYSADGIFARYVARRRLPAPSRRSVASG
jgi:SAM-dependent methyltransferase